MKIDINKLYKELVEIINGDPMLMQSKLENCMLTHKYLWYGRYYLNCDTVIVIQVQPTSHLCMYELRKDFLNGTCEFFYINPFKGIYEKIY